ncbi:MAG TPA: sensor domain-containing protein [Catenuloplanes sp.]
MTTLRWPDGLRYSRRTWTALVFTVTAVPLALIGFVVVIVLVLAGAALTITPAGPWIIALGTRTASALATLHRGAARRLLDEDLPDPGGPGGRGLLGWRRRALTDPAGWRATAYVLLKPLVVVPPGALALLWLSYGTGLAGYPVIRLLAGDVSIGDSGMHAPARQLALCALGVALLVLAPPVLRMAVVGDAALMRALLTPGGLRQRVRDLEKTRAYAVADATAQLGRIERDLHDGTQARLVALGMKLALIEAAGDLGRARELARGAREDTRGAIVELRELVRGFHPPVLADGLTTALTTLASECAVRAELVVELPQRPPPEIEAIVYFCAAELLTNIVKHSGASRATVTVRVSGDRLRLLVTDNGRGGAQLYRSDGPGGPGGRTGLTGLLARARTVDGDVSLDSPPGGGTVVTVELPRTAVAPR